MTDDFWELQWRKNTSKYLTMLQKQKAEIEHQAACCFMNYGLSESSSAKTSPRDLQPPERPDHLGKLKLSEMMTHIMNSGRGFFLWETSPRHISLHLFTWWTKCVKLFNQICDSIHYTWWIRGSLPVTRTTSHDLAVLHAFFYSALCPASWLAVDPCQSTPSCTVQKAFSLPNLHD